MSKTYQYATIEYKDRGKFDKKLTEMINSGWTKSEYKVFVYNNSIYYHALMVISR